MTRVCFLSYTHPYYDTRILHREAHSLAANDYDVFHVAPSAENGNLTVENVKIVLYSTRPGWFGRIRRFFTLYRRGVELNADIYHCNEIASWLVGCAIKLFHRQKRVIFDVHEHYPSRFEEPRFPVFLKWLGKPLIHTLYWILTPWTDHLIFAKRSVAPDFPFSSGKSTYVFNYGIIQKGQKTLQDVDSSVRDEFANLKTAIHVGSFSRTRGWPQLLLAMSIMRNKDLHLFCYDRVIEGEDTFLSEAHRLGVQDRIHLHKRLPFDEMFDRLLCADIGLMLYQPGILNHVYAFPMKMYDYMLAGLTFLAPRFAVEVAPVVQESECGLLVDTSNPEEIAQALDWLCEHPELATTMGQRGRQAIFSKYNWDTEAEKLLGLYRDLSLSTL